MQDDLQPIEPQRAKEMYLAERRGEVAAETYETHDYNLRWFIKFCEKERIKNLNVISGRDLHEYRLWRKNSGINRVTLQSQLSTLRVFMRYCESIEAVPDGLADKIILPSRNRSDSRTEMIDEDTADQILAYLRKFHYASRDHALFKLLWHTGMRTGAVQSLDVDDFQPRNQSLSLRHRPEKETTLKNGYQGERIVALSDGMCTVLNDYLDTKRKGVTDEYGREPLFTTKYGRLGKVTIRRTVYRLTRPCEYGDGCPHGREIDDCEAAVDYDMASRCPSSVSAHPIRRGSITHHLLKDVPETAVSDRCDVSSDVLDAHYDQRTEVEKMEQRREYLDNI